MMTREEFKRYAAGTFVIGKSSFDHKMLEAYMDGALNAWDMFNKQKKVIEDQSQHNNQHQDSYDSLAVVKQ